MKHCPKCHRQLGDECDWCPECGTIQRMRKASPEELLDRVVDRDSFIEFARALAEERQEAEQDEQRNRVRFQLGGAREWQNGNVASFIYGALDYFSEKPLHTPEKEPSWKMFADFFYHGKIIE
jgi:hypothetical protein